MNPYPYWQQQNPDQPLFSDLAWSKPENRLHAGKLGIVGGNKLGFAGVAEAYGQALKTGAGQVRVLLPDILKKALPATMTDAIYGPTNPSGSLTKDAQTSLMTLAGWSDQILLIGDAGRSSETAILYEQFLGDYSGPLTITRDAIDLVKNNAQAIVDRPQTLVIASFAQLQKIFQTIYYPKVLTFSMQLTNLVDALHKFTITYPVTIAVLHKDTFIVAGAGQVVTTPWSDPMLIWRGVVAAKAATYWLWNPLKPLQSVATAISSL